MKQEKKYILKNVLTADSIEGKTSWGFNTEDNKVLCPDCLSPLFYVSKEWGIVEEESQFPVVGYIMGKKHLVLREVGLALYCAECGAFEERYDTWAYPDNKIICTWRDEDLDYAEIGEIEYAMNVYNKTGDLDKKKFLYKGTWLYTFQEKIKEYEKKNKIDIEELKLKNVIKPKKVKNAKRTAKRKNKK